jgi:peptide/nickel transport system substrate-binding protein
VSIPNTLTTTVTETKYKSTTSGTTSTTSTSTVTLVSTSISYTTFPTTITKTTTSGKTTFTIPPIPTKCIIASAAYGSELSPQVQALRTFRDKIVLSTFAGTQFMKAFNAWYYSFSPTLGGLVSESQWIAASARALIYPLIGILQVAAATYAMFSFNPELGVTVAGVLGSSLIGIVYCTPWVTALLIGVKRKRRFEMGMRHLIPFVTSWIVGLFLIGVAMLLLAPILMMIATAAVVLLSLGLSATGVAMLISRKLTVR